MTVSKKKPYRKMTLEAFNEFYTNKISVKYVHHPSIRKIAWWAWNEGLKRAGKAHVKVELGRIDSRIGGKIGDVKE